MKFYPPDLPLLPLSWKINGGLVEHKHGVFYPKLASTMEGVEEVEDKFKVAKILIFAKE